MECPLPRLRELELELELEESNGAVELSSYLSALDPIYYLRTFASYPS